MNDQAANLRKQMERAETGKTTKVVSIISGKGGVGKTNFSVNLGIGLSQLGKKVLIIDLDIGMANIDIVTGITTTNSIVDMIEEKLSIFNIMTTGPAGLSFISGGSGLTEIFQLDALKLSYFIRQIELLHSHFDYILFDLGAGITKDSLNFILASDEAILILTPEPTSITDGYALVKALNQHEQRLSLHMIVNSCDNEDEGYETAVRFKRATREFLGLDISIIGTLPFDRTVSQAVRTQIPFLLYAPKSKVSKAMNKIIYSYTGHAVTETKGLQGFISTLSNLLSPRKKRGSRNG